MNEISISELIGISPNDNGEVYTDFLENFIQSLISVIGEHRTD